MKIAVVDDNQALRMLIRLTLELTEHEVIEAKNADEGLDLIKQLQPDVVLLDVRMPGRMDGLGLCRLIRKTPELAHIKVIMLSAGGQQSDLQDGLGAGADHYIAKPFSPTELLQIIKTIGATRTK